MHLHAALPTRTCDVGPGGLCVESLSPFDRDAIRRVEIGLPDGPLMTRAEGRWQREGLESTFSFVDAAGEPVLLKPGQSFVQVIRAGFETVDITP